MDIDLGIFIIIDSTNANVNDDYFIDGLKLSQNQPNPASIGNTLVQYELQNESMQMLALKFIMLSGKCIVDL